MTLHRGYQRGKLTMLLVASYILDWLILITLTVLGFIIGNITPNQRPFSLEDRDISYTYFDALFRSSYAYKFRFPFNGDTVSAANLALTSVVTPAVIITLIAIVFVPGNTVPHGTPTSLIWKRKLWELHTGLLGLLLSVCSTWFITNGMKNLSGKPRPNLLARCQPDLANFSQYIVGGIANISSNGQLVSGAICKNPDKAMIDEGFRAFPSGHSSISAAGLIYLSLFIASKFTITPPFLAPAGYADVSFIAFPSRHRQAHNGGVGELHELRDRRSQNAARSSPADLAPQKHAAQHNSNTPALRQRAAAPPLYLLLVAVIPFFASVFISLTRWYDFQHHGSDILFAFIMGMVASVFAFRYYHLPISQGAGWAWGPRSHEKAFWAGIGSISYSTQKYRADVHERPSDGGQAVEMT